MFPAMRDYEPLDLRRVCNAGVRVLGSNAKPALGPRTFHGLPFLVGRSPRRCFIAFGDQGKTRGSVTIAIGKKARWVLFAHLLLESRLLEGEPVGRVIAHYCFRYANGEKIAVPIRERLEITVIPPVWGQWPLLDRKSVV